MLHSFSTLEARRLCSRYVRYIKLNQRRISHFGICGYILARLLDCTYLLCRHKCHRGIFLSSHSLYLMNNYTVVCTNQMIQHKCCRHMGTVERIHSQTISGCKYSLKLPYTVCWDNNFLTQHIIHSNTWKVLLEDMTRQNKPFPQAPSY